MPPAPLKPAVLVCLIGFAVARIVSTYPVLSQTWDEGGHLGVGMQWWDQGRYAYEVGNPPLARIAIALGPFWSGLRHQGGVNAWQEGNAILHAGGDYARTLALARMGVLPFFVLATLLVWVWSRWLFGEAAALITVLLFTTLPPVLAHAGLATVDMALTAMGLGALLAFVWWLEQPTTKRSVLLGVAVGLAVLSKLSALLFLPACALAIVAWRWVVSRKQPSGAFVSPPTRRVVGLVVVSACLVIWAGYRCSLVPFTTAAERPHELIDRLVGTQGLLRGWAYWLAETVPVPAHPFFLGLGHLWHQQHIGFPSYLFGQVRTSGWWYFFPVAIAVKSPIPFLLLAGLGMGALARRSWRERLWQPMVPVLAAAAILLVCLPITVNVGVRHILAIYPLLALAAGVGTVALWKAGRSRWIGPLMTVALVGWQAGSSLAAHPDYLAYFNELAGKHPERILVDSDLDWGQDLLRLVEELRARHVERVAIAYNGSADLSRHGLPAFRPLAPHQPTTGWIAISEMRLKIGEGRPPYDEFAWLEAYEPVARVGRSIRLYHVPPSS